MPAELQPRPFKTAAPAERKEATTAAAACPDMVVYTERTLKMALSRIQPQMKEGFSPLWMMNTRASQSSTESPHIAASGLVAAVRASIGKQSTLGASTVQFSHVHYHPLLLRATREFSKLICLCCLWLLIRRVSRAPAVRHCPLRSALAHSHKKAPASSCRATAIEVTQDGGLFR